MKFVAYIFAAIVFFTVLLSPGIELLSAFGDICVINAVVVSSSRAAASVSETSGDAINVESKIDIDEFKEKFKENFCTALNLDDYYQTRDNKYNDFTVNFILVGENKCKIEVKTVNKFKTAIFNKYLSDISSSSVEVVNIQKLELEN